jgi:hypothetical protein
MDDDPSLHGRKWRPAGILPSATTTLRQADGFRRNNPSVSSPNRIVRTTLRMVQQVSERVWKVSPRQGLGGEGVTDRRTRNTRFVLTGRPHPNPLPEGEGTANIGIAARGPLFSTAALLDSEGVPEMGRRFLGRTNYRGTRDGGVGAGGAGGIAGAVGGAGALGATPRTSADLPLKLSEQRFRVTHL